MIWSKPRFQHSIELFPRVLREVIPLLLPLSLILWGLEYYVSYLNKERFANPYESSMALIISAGFGAVILENLISVTWIILVARSTQRQMKNGTGEKSSKFLIKNFHQTLIEIVRATISVGIYSLFFVIPGVIRWVQLVFTGFVSCFDKDYQDGQRDALKESKRLVKGKWFPIMLLLLIQMIIPTALEEVGKGTSLPVTVALYTIAWMISLYFAIYLTLTFFAVSSYKLRKS